jgi:hypothetical protein
MCPAPRSANFFDDAGCTQNGGIGVDIRNPGCLGEAGRGSVFIPNTGLGTTPDNQFCFVITHGDGSCSCQSSSNTFTATGFCKVLDPSDQSYRFVGVSTHGQRRLVVRRTRTGADLFTGCLRPQQLLSASSASRICHCRTTKPSGMNLYEYERNY